MERASLSRWRWRMRGAWMWPAFFALTFVDALLLHVRPLSGDGTGLVPAALLAGFFNLVAIAVVAPLVGRLVRRRRRDLPKMVAVDYAGSALLVLTTLALAGAGQVHQGEIEAGRQELRTAFVAVHRYVADKPEYRDRLALADPLALEKRYYRICVPGRTDQRRLCLLVNVNQAGGGVKVDPGRQSNEQLRLRPAGPGS